MIFGTFWKKPVVNPDILQGNHAEFIENRHLDSPEDDIAGIELHSFASSRGITSDAVWEKIREGKLIARTENGYVYVYGNAVPALLTNSDALLEQSDYPPISERHQIIPHDDAGHVQALIEHLTISRDHTQSLLKFAEDSLAQMKLVTDELIRSKDRELELQRQLNHQNEVALTSSEALIAAEKAQKIKLMQEVEDLQMLTKAAGIS